MTAADRAAQFLEALGDPDRPWLLAFPAWAEGQRLTPAQARDVRTEIIRIRAFGAATRGAENARRTAARPQRRGRR